MRLKALKAGTKILPVITRKGSISAPFFLIALVVLLTAEHNILTWVGVAVAVTGIVLVFLGHIELAMADGLLSATASFVIQSITGVCPSCTYAAVLFALAGISLMFYLVPKKPLLTILLVVPLMISLCMFAGNLKFYRNNHFEPVYIAQAIGVSKSNKPVLYFSPWCSHCKEPLSLLVKKDPTGELWQPAVIPHHALAEGEILLSGLGYCGMTISAPNSPSGGLPCIELPNGKILTGQSKILLYCEGSEPI